MTTTTQTTPRMMTAAEVAAELRLHERTVTRLATTGVLPAVRIGGQWRFRRADIDGICEPTPNTQEQHR